MIKLAITFSDGTVDVTDCKDYAAMLAVIEFFDDMADEVVTILAESIDAL